jgi:hypothetical protein
MTATVSLFGPRLKAGFGVGGSVMNDPGDIGFRSFETGGEQYEHFAIGDTEEGFALFYNPPGGANLVAHDVYATLAGDLVNITQVSDQNLVNDANEFVKQTLSRTTDGMLEIRNMLTFAADATRVTIRMDITNIGKQALTNVLVKRYCDMDVDTGGPNGWALFQNHFSKDTDSVHAWNQPTEVRPPGKHAHIVNMVAMPSDVPLDETFVGLFGFDQFKTRANLFPILNAGRHDGIGVLQWEATRLRVGESIRLNMYYDAFALVSDIPLTYKHDPATVRPEDITVAGRAPIRGKKPQPTKT